LVSGLTACLRYSPSSVAAAAATASCPTFIALEDAQEDRLLSIPPDTAVGAGEPDGERGFARGLPAGEEMAIGFADVVVVGGASGEKEEEEWRSVEVVSVLGSGDNVLRGALKVRIESDSCLRTSPRLLTITPCVSDSLLVWCESVRPAG
jgi:hypothetical protein